MVIFYQKVDVFATVYIQKPNILKINFNIV